MAKARKSILKRFKFTRRGKILHRPVGQNHFRAKKSSNKIRALRKWVPVPKSEWKIIKRYLGTRIKGL